MHMFAGPRASHLGAQARTRLLSCRASNLPPGLDQLEHCKGAPRIKIERGKAQLFYDGNPLVFTNAVQDTVGEPQTGDAVVVSDYKDTPMAWGVYNDTSLFKCRILQLNREVRADPSAALNIDALLKIRIMQAAELRRTICLPNEDTNVYRLINSEGDRLSGLTVDVLADHIVVTSSALWVEEHRAVIIEALQATTGLAQVSWRRDERQLAADRGQKSTFKMQEDSVDAEDDEAGPPAFSPRSEKVIVMENGVKFLSDPMGQKSGFYADQRENRKYLRHLVEGKRVLDLCCYSGGFAINAALYGASEVVGVDSSAAAIELAERNAGLNDVADKCSFVCIKAEEYLAELVEDELPLFDVIILDPPKLAPIAKFLPRALAKYEGLNIAAMRALNDGGLLMTCSCSGAVAQSRDDVFTKTIASAARKLRKHASTLRDAGAGPDHTLDPNFSHGKYLTNKLVRVIAS